MTSEPTNKSLQRQITLLKRRIAALERGKVEGAPCDTRPDLVVDVVCQVCEVERHQVFSKRRPDKIAWPRQVIMYLLVTRLRWNTMATANYFTRDHSTATHAVATVRDRIITEPAKQQQMRAILALLGLNDLKEAA